MRRGNDEEAHGVFLRFEILDDRPAYFDVVLLISDVPCGNGPRHTLPRASATAQELLPDKEAL